jgi:hypothetical protein
MTCPPKTDPQLWSLKDKDIDIKRFLSAQEQGNLDKIMKKAGLEVSAQVARHSGVVAGP